MKSNNKVSYILTFLLSIILLLDIALIITRFTVLNKNYLFHKIDTNNYKEIVYQEISESLEEYIPSSGFTNVILVDLFTKEQVSNDIDSVVNGLYDNKDILVSSDLVKEKLLSNIDKYIKDNKLTVNSNLDGYINSLIGVYRSKILIMEKIVNYNYLIPKIITIVNISILIISIIVIITLILFIKLKKIDLTIMFYTIGFVLAIMVFYIMINTRISYITILSEVISKIIINIIEDLFKLSIVISIISFITGTIFLIKKK